MSARRPGSDRQRPPASRAGSTATPDEGDCHGIRDRPRDRLLGEPVQDEGRKTHRDDDLGKRPASPVEERSPGARSAAHSVEEQADGAERQAQKRRWIEERGA